MQPCHAPVVAGAIRQVVPQIRPHTPLLNDCGHHTLRGLRCTSDAGTGVLIDNLLRQRLYRYVKHLSP
jgi:hypothetical protein